LLLSRSRPVIEAQSSDCVVFLNLMSSVGGVMIATVLDD
jgi:hypothetical protein